MRRGWLYGLVCTVFASVSIGYGSAVNAVVLDDDCECRSGWQSSRTYVHCPSPDRGPRDCPLNRVIDEQANPYCDRSLSMPPIVITETLIRNWIWSSELMCEGLNWPSNTPITVRIPAVGVSPCAVARRIVVYFPNCYVEAYVCSDPQKETKRLYRECIPRPVIEYGRIEGCVCPHPVQIVVIDEGIIDPYPVDPVSDGIGVPGTRKILL